ncbi:germin-like protein subfamily 1 member 16 [Morus notabilis]|uniref:germin-like protein subfamily 1 member 16 n=1 Tax=Morus notabilis TaxID=981085 RepID=UPI000CECFC7E|nr:germin-like protein subfamily 1 member 16 [Morus notabilis]
MAKNSVNSVLVLLASALATYIAFAADPGPLQDFCVATNDPKHVLFVNGKFCKNPELVKAEDFFFSGIDIPRDTNNAVGSNVSMVNVDNLPGLNTLGVSLARLDFAPYGLNPPHTHPRSSEILVVTEGTLYAGFVSSDEDGNRLFTKTLHKGDVFVFPIGMIHFQFNIGEDRAVAFAGFGSQNEGRITIANTLFGSHPSIKAEVLAKAFMLDKDVVEKLQKKFGQ